MNDLQGVLLTESVWRKVLPCVGAKRKGFDEKAWRARLKR
jgi:hypothetical protein